jgi:hypothetical protein
MTKEYSTVLILSLSLTGLFLVFDSVFFLYGSLLVGTLSLVFPFCARKIHFLWMKLSVLLGNISSVIILAVIFFVLITPLAYLAKLVGKKFVVLAKTNKSYFKQRNFVYNDESIENLW